MSYSTADLVLLAVAILLAVPMLVFSVECLLASVWRRNVSLASPSTLPRVDVIIPAHNEEQEIEAALASAMAQLRPTDRIFVVADNCSDATADIARACGAKVLERNSVDQRGKSYTLQFASDYLRQHEPAPVVLFLDADCRLEKGALEQLVHAASTNVRPAQAAYVINCDTDSRPLDRLSGFAVLVKNVVRPLGMQRLGLPCLLTGSGMAFPWSILENTDLASGSIVEDTQLSVDLSLERCGPTFVDSALVVSRLPEQPHAKRSQRMRWEHGHLATLVSQVPRLMWAALRQRRIDLPMVALDLCVPPLSFLVLVWMVGITAAAISFSAGHGAAPLVILAASAGFMLLGTIAAWWRFGRGQLPLSTLLAAPWYVLSKLPIYFWFFVRRETSWTRTERDHRVSVSEHANADSN